MTYTLWSRGRLLGQSDLDYVRWLPKLRTGDFFPTELGEQLMPIVTGMRQAWIDCTKALREDVHRDIEAHENTDDDDFERSTAYADVAAAQAHFEALELELRGPDGSIIPTESIDVRDNEVTLSFAHDCDDVTLPDPLFAETEEEKNLLAAIEHDAALLEEWFGPDWDCEDDKPWEEEPSFPRYQIYVDLLDDAAIP